jgi:hypothetical protein
MRENDESNSRSKARQLMRSKMINLRFKASNKKSRFLPLRLLLILLAAYLHPAHAMTLVEVPAGLSSLPNGPNQSKFSWSHNNEGFYMTNFSINEKTCNGGNSAAFTVTWKDEFEAENPIVRVFGNAVATHKECAYVRASTLPITSI